jgi:hypothetical protein
MRLPVRFGTAVSFLAIAFAAACGSDNSTGPSQSDTPSSVAQHFDSIYVQSHALSNGGSNAFELRAQLATLIEVNAAFGATPSAVTVHTASGTEHWKGYQLLEINSGGDTTYLLLAYRDASAHSVAVIYFDGAGAISQAALVTNDTVIVQSTSRSGSTSLTSTGATCGAISSALLNPGLTSVDIASCNLATFNTTASMQLPSTTGVDAALTSFSMSGATVNGIRVVDAGSNRRVHDLLRMNQGPNKL